MRLSHGVNAAMGALCIVLLFFVIRRQLHWRRKNEGASHALFGSLLGAGLLALCWEMQVCSMTTEVCTYSLELLFTLGAVLLIQSYFQSGRIRFGLAFLFLCGVGSWHSVFLLWLAGGILLLDLFWTHKYRSTLLSLLATFPALTGGYFMGGWLCGLPLPAYSFLQLTERLSSNWGSQTQLLLQEPGMLLLLLACAGPIATVETVYRAQRISPLWKALGFILCLYIPLWLLTGAGYRVVPAKQFPLLMLLAAAASSGILFGRLIHVLSSPGLNPALRFGSMFSAIVLSALVGITGHPKQRHARLRNALMRKITQEALATIPNGSLISGASWTSFLEGSAPDSAELLFVSPTDNIFQNLKIKSLADWFGVRRVATWAAAGPLTGWHAGIRSAPERAKHIRLFLPSNTSLPRNEQIQLIPEGFLVRPALRKTLSKEEVARQYAKQTTFTEQWSALLADYAAPLPLWVKSIREELSRQVNNTGVLQQDFGFLPEAETAYRMALALKPGNTVAAFNLCALLDPTAPWIKQIERRSTQDLSDLTTWNGTLRCSSFYRRRGESLFSLLPQPHPSARFMLKRAAQIAPDDPAAQQALALLEPWNATSIKKIADQNDGEEQTYLAFAKHAERAEDYEAARQIIGLGEEKNVLTNATECLHADLLIKQGKPNEARRMMTAFCDRNPNSFRGWRVGLQALLAENDLQAMDPWFSRYSSRMGPYEGVTIGKGDIAAHLGEWLQAYNCYREVLNEFPDWTFLNEDCIQAMFHANKSDIPLARAVLRINPNSPEAFYAMASYQAATGDGELAQDSLLYSYELKPDPQTLSTAIQYLTQRTDVDPDGGLLFSWAQQTPPKEASAWFMLANELVEEENDTDAETALWNGLDIEINAPAVHQLLYMLSVGKADRNVAAKSLERGLQFIENPTVLNNCAWYMQELGFLPQAESWARKAQRIDTFGSRQIAHTLGTILARKGEFEKAAPLLEPACEKVDIDVNSLVPLLACYTALDRPKKTAGVVHRIAPAKSSLKSPYLEWYENLCTP